MKAIVTQNLSLLDALLFHFPENTKTSLRSWIKLGRITVDGKVVTRADHIVTPGQTLRLEPRARVVNAGIKLLYEDNHIVVIDKPSGILAVATKFEKGSTAHSYLKEHYKPRPVFVVHRLDQDTSGVMIFSLSEKATEELKKMFEKHTLERMYCAIVEGKMIDAKGTWTNYLYEDPCYHVHVTKTPEIGQLATTHFEVKQTSKKYSYLDLTLETGRKNQIRVHCQHAGHPVVGDKKYGSTINPLHRLCLHARRLAFNHPITHKRMCFESPVPQEFHHLMGDKDASK